MATHAAHAPEPEATQRLDKWLWFARVVKTRTLAAGLVEDGKVRVNRSRIAKPSHAVKSGDVVTVTAHRQVRVLKVVAAGVRRGSASEARTLFEDLTPGSGSSAATGMGAHPDDGAEPGPDSDGVGHVDPAGDTAQDLSPSPEPPARPDKQARRALIALKRG